MMKASDFAPPGYRFLVQLDAPTEWAALAAARRIFGQRDYVVKPGMVGRRWLTQPNAGNHLPREHRFGPGNGLLHEGFMVFVKR